DREVVPDLPSLCGARLSHFLSHARDEWAQGLDRALRELPPGPKMHIRARADWPCELPEPVFRREAPVSLPRDPEEAWAAAREVAGRTRRAAGRAASELHRG